jgi:hypothetical protein
MEHLAMNAHLANRPNWSTSAHGTSADTSPMELSALGDHLDLCRHSHARWVAVQGVAQRVHGFAASRFMTTLALAAVLLVGLALLY